MYVSVFLQNIKKYIRLFHKWKWLKNYGMGLMSQEPKQLEG